MIAICTPKLENAFSVQNWVLDQIFFEIELQVGKKCIIEKLLENFAIRCFWHFDQIASFLAEVIYFSSDGEK